MMIRRVLPVTLVLLAAGCGFLSRPKNTFYSLSTIPASPPAVATAAGTAAGTPIGIEAIELPPGLDRRGIVIRGADHKVEVRGTHQWTASLEEMVLHTLAFDLANRLPEGTVILPGQAKPGGVMRSISVVFEELAPGQDQVFVLDARWTVSQSGRADVSHHERITVPMASMESPAIVDAMSQALATLADRMAGSPSS
jgi:uncharacterized lipoprotein YmbA